jgi:hypothetical protein
MRADSPDARPTARGVSSVEVVSDLSCILALCKGLLLSDKEDDRSFWTDLLFVHDVYSNYKQRLSTTIS